MSTATDTELRDNLKTWKDALSTLVAENAEIVGTIAEVKDGKVVVDDSRSAKFRENRKEIETLQGLVKDAEAHLGDKGFMDAPAQDPIATLVAAIEHGKGVQPQAFKSIGAQFVESPEFKQLIAERGLTMRAPWDINIADLAGKSLHGRKDVYTAMPTGTPGQFGTVQRDPLIPLPQRRSRIRDLFNVQQTNSPIIEFFRQTGFTNNASPVHEYDVNEFGLKPQSEIAFEGVQTTVKTIAHWEAASRNVLADEPQLRGIIDTELLYGLQLAEDHQILQGTGTGEDLPGILNDTDLQDYAWSSGPNAAATGTVGDNKLDALRRAMTMVTLAYYETTGIVMHDNDWEDCELQKDKNGQYLLATSIAAGGEQRTWRVPVVTTPAMPEGYALLGAFGLGAQLYDREAASIRVAEQHADFFVRNGIVVLAEERLALAVKRPESFVLVHFDHAPS